MLNELKDMYHQTVRTINQMNYADLMKPFRSDDPLQRPVVAWVTGNTSAHFAEHRSYIERVLRDGQA